MYRTNVHLVTFVAMALASDSVHFRASLRRFSEHWTDYILDQHQRRNAETVARKMAYMRRSWLTCVFYEWALPPLCQRYSGLVCWGRPRQVPKAPMFG